MKYIARNIWGDGESTEIKTTGSGVYLRIKKLHFDMVPIEGRKADMEHGK